MNRLSRLLQAFPFKTSVVVGLLCFVVVQAKPDFVVKLKFTPEHIKQAEFYPFSSFPMYSKFSANPSYLYLTDATGAPIACQPTLGVRASVIKKIYDKEVRIVGKREDTSISKLAQPLKQEAGLATLRVLREDVAKERVIADNIGPLRLQEVIIRRGKGGKIEETTTFVGEL
ncbi:MAG: hypothetical protein ACI9R3_003861 [Verrucomicrobiales bacterium]|jgi:hypothetical protein